MDTKRFNEEHAAKSREVCERIEREDAERRSKLSDLMGIERKGELGRAKAEADGWRRVAKRRLGHIDECEAALAKRNERIRELEKQAGYLRAELANAKVLSERERQILDMWPRFEDGERVMVGDAVKLPTYGAISAEAIEFTAGKVDVKDAADGGWNTSMYAMHPLKRPAPKVLDADGVEIKVGDTVWNDDGVEMTVTSLVGELPGHVTAHGDNPPATYSINPKRLTHTRPDSWERLEEDARKGVCEYAGAYRKSGTIDSHECDGCRFDDDGNGPTCEQQMALDIIRRAKALAGVEVGE